MSKIFVSCLLLLVCGSTHAQENTFNKEAELQKFVERGGKYEETAPNIYWLTYPTGETRVFNLNPAPGQNISTEGVDTTIINVWEIDTLLYYQKFSFWQKVQVANSFWGPLPIEDLNHNGRPELYGYTDYWNIGPPCVIVRIFERDMNGIYKMIYSYDSSSIFVHALGDINRTGNKEIYLRSHIASNGVVYRSDSLLGLPTTLDFIFYYTPNQINNMTFGDFDNNGITDCAFIDASNPSKIIIGEYRASINNFLTLYEQTTEGESPSGFAINDFDQDGKTEIVVSTGNGNVYIIENVEENQYSLVKQFSFPGYNAYMKTVTSDIDGNGKPEFWIGRQNFVEGISIFQCYEAIEDNTYKIIAYIELRGLVSLYTYFLQAVDIDSDEKEEELIISIGNTVLVLKFDGVANFHHYKVFYAKIREATQPGVEFYPVAISDLDGDNRKDILLPFYKSRPDGYIYAFSYILRQNSTSGINMISEGYNNFDSISSYPNPFNSLSTISFSLKENANVTLKIYNCLGEEINTLINQGLLDGRYEIMWNSKDNFGNIVPSGVYLIVLQENDLLKSSKILLLK